ncbi:MAG: hypothetical protein A2286_03445 [Gammaproteobacteria bacterium RIFOXYA12_FULL_61_12]|nr:MAG: hypothetical protein A2286_03445 [Gammaproteobacteria bacterium RIFOXYA12_FULL_61_12]
MRVSGKNPPADARLKRACQLAQADEGIAILWLYGSRARGDARPDSDYDFAVAFNDFLTSDPLEARLRPELLALEWQNALALPEGALSVIDINRVPIPLAWNVIQEGSLLFCRDERRLIQEEQRIWSRMELDILPALRQRAGGRRS